MLVMVMNRGGSEAVARTDPVATVPNTGAAGGRVGLEVSDTTTTAPMMKPTASNPTSRALIFILPF